MRPLLKRTKAPDKSVLVLREKLVLSAAEVTECPKGVTAGTEKLVLTEGAEGLAGTEASTQNCSGSVALVG